MRGDARDSPEPATERPQDPNEDDRKLRRQQAREKYKAADPDRARRQHLESQRRSRERQRADAARRKQARDRVRDWTAANPERARARKEAWNLENPDRVREHKRNYYARNREQRQHAAREQNARRRQDPAQREKESQYRTANRDQLNAQQKARRSNPSTRAKDNQAQNERRRIDRRLRKLGLPSRRQRRTALNERSTNAEAAENFFTRKRSGSEIHLLQEELNEVQGEAALGSEKRWHEELEIRIRVDAERPARIRALLDKHLATQAGAVLREEVRMDSIARQLRGAEPYPDLTAELRRRAATALIARRAALTPQLLARRPLPEDRLGARAVGF